MTPRRSRENFVSVVIVIQILVSFHTVRCLSCSDQSSIDGLVSQRTTSSLPCVHSSDSCLPTTMTSELGTLKLPPFPAHYELWPEWTTAVLAVCQNTNYRVRNADQNWEHYSYLSMALFGLRWRPDIRFGNGPAQIMNSRVIIAHSTLSADEIAFLKEDEALFHWTLARTHRTMQIALRTAVLKAMEDSPFYNDLLAFIKTWHTYDGFVSRIANLGI